MPSQILHIYMIIPNVHSQALGPDSSLRPALSLSMCRPDQTEYWILVRYRNSATKWKWQQRWCKRKRPMYPGMNPPKTTSKRPLYPLGSWQREAELQRYINNFLYQSFQCYLHSSESPASPQDLPAH